MNAREFAGGYIKASELNSPLNARILDVSEGTDFNNNRCLVLSLNEGGKMQLKVRDVNAMIALFGDQTENWLGKAITLTTADDVFDGRSYKKFVISEYQPTQQAEMSQAPQAGVPQAPPTPKMPDDLGF